MWKKLGTFDASCCIPPVLVLEGLVHPVTRAYSNDTLQPRACDSTTSRHSRNEKGLLLFDVTMVGIVAGCFNVLSMRVLFHMHFLFVMWVCN